MSNDYLKQLQLTKQLEQKAKEATKNRKAAEDVLTKAGETLAKAKVPDMDLSEAEKALAEANAAFGRRDYTTALAAANKAVEIIPEAERAAVASVLSSSEAVLALVPGDGREAEAKASMAAARGLLEQGKSDEALTTARSSREHAERYLGMRISEMVAGMHHLLTLAEKQGIAVADRQKSLAEVEALHRQGDRTVALERLRTGHEDIAKAFSEAFGERSDKIMTVVDDAATAGAGISSLTATLEKAKADLDTGLVEKAMTDLAAAEKTLDAALAAAVESCLAVHRERAAWLEERGVSSEEFLAVGAKASEAVKAGFGAGSLDWLRKSERALRDSEAAVVLEEVRKLRPGLILARKIGNNLSGPLAKLEEARLAVQSARAPRAVELVAEAASQLDNLLRGHLELEGDLKRTAKQFRRARMYRVNVEAAGDAVKASRETALKGDLEGATRKLRGAQDILFQKVCRHCAEKIFDCEVDIAFAAGMGADTGPEAAELDDLVGMLKQGSSDDALMRLSRVDRAIRNKGKERALGSVEKAETAVGGIPGVDMVLSMEGAKEARRILEAGDWKGAHLAAMDVLATTESQQRQARAGQMAMAKRLMEMGRLLGCESLTLDQKMIAAGSASGTVEALCMLGGMIQFFRAIIRDELGRAIPDLTKELCAQRKNGVAVTSAERHAEEASEALAADDMEKSFTHLKEGEKELQKAVSLHKEVGGLIALIATHVDDARPAAGKYGVPALLKEARDLYGAGKYDGARISARKCYQELERTGASVLAPQKLREAQELVEVLRQVVKGPIEADEDIRLANSHLSRGDNAAALTAAKEAHGRAAERLVAAIVAEIGQTGNLLEGGKRRRPDLPASFNIIAEAEGLLAQKRYSDAIRAVRSARNEAERIVRIERSAHNELERAGLELAEMEKQGIDIGEPRQTVARSLAALEGGERDMAVEAARRALKGARKTAGEALAARVGAVEAELGAERLKGRDLAPMEAEVRKGVRERLERHRHTEAADLIGAYADKLRKMSELRETCAASLAEKEDERRLGWPLVDLAEELLAKAQAAFDSGAFVETQALLKERAAVRSAAQALNDRSAARLSDARMRIEQEGGHFPNDGIAALLDKAAEDLAQGLYADMERSVMKATAELARFRDKSLSGDVAEVVRLIQVLRVLGVNLYSLPERTQALLDMRMSELREGSVYLTQDIAVLKRTAVDKLTSSETALREKTEMAKAARRQTGVGESLLEEAKKALADGDAEKALSLQKAARSALGASEDDAAAHHDALARLHEALATARALDIDVSGAVALLHEASRLEGDLPGATRRLIDAVKTLDEKLTAYLPVIRLDAVPLDASEGRRRIKVRAQNIGGGIALDLSVEEGAGLLLPEMLRPGEAVEGTIETSEGSVSLSYRGLMCLMPRTVNATLC